MYLIQEVKTKYGTVYEKVIYSNNVISTLGALGFIKQSSNTNMYYFIVMDQNGQLCENINYYLNVVMKNAGYKTRENAYNSLKLLYSYCLLFDFHSLEDFSYVEINKLTQFLYGGKSEGNFITLNINTTRHKNTVLKYLNVYNHYYRTTFNKQTSPFNNSQYLPKTNYKAKRASNTFSYYLNQTRYINTNQFEKILKIINDEYTVREYLIIYLMYIYGLRIGEVLGLTLEDLKHDDQKYKLVIRNRLTDKPWQKAKGVLTPDQKHDYERSIFNEFDSGFQVIYISKSTFNYFDDYIEESRTSSNLMESSSRLKNFNTKCIADNIDASLGSISNQYIFLSKNLFKPLSATGWNSIIRDIFEKANIPTDKNRRRMNLNHKFRHGFAMNLVKEGIDPNQLAKRMRHKSVTSTYKYYNPDEKDQMNILEKYKDSIGDKYDFRI